MPRHKLPLVHNSENYGNIYIKNPSMLFYEMWWTYNYLIEFGVGYKNVLQNLKKYT